MNWDEIKNRLAEPFDHKRISWRVGSVTKDKKKAMALAYIDARDVMKRLDDVCGALWQNDYPLSDGTLLICKIGIKIDDEWLWRANGAGDTQVEAEKGKASDAFKRAAVQWGVGKYLHSLPNSWVEIDEWKKIIKPPSLPTWATPEGYWKIINDRKEAKS